jgi:hypothetical protein
VLFRSSVKLLSFVKLYSQSSNEILLDRLQNSVVSLRTTKDGNDVWKKTVTNVCPSVTSCDKFTANDKNIWSFNFDSGSTQSSVLKVQWFDNSQALGWDKLESLCTGKGLRLCTYSEICPGGEGESIVGGIQSTSDAWCPVIEDVQACSGWGAGCRQYAHCGTFSNHIVCKRVTQGSTIFQTDSWLLNDERADLKERYSCCSSLYTQSSATECATFCPFSAATLTTSTSYTLNAGSTCQMASQASISGNNVNILIGNATAGSTLAIIERALISCNTQVDGKCRLFKVGNGATLTLRWVHLRGGRTSIDNRGENQLGYSGGLVHVLGTGTTLDARHVIFSRGLACEGGGLYGRHSAALILQDCLLTDNVARGVSIDRVGGGICIEQNANLALVDSTIIGNHAQGPELAQGIGITSGSSVAVVRSDIRDGVCLSDNIEKLYVLDSPSLDAALISGQTVVDSCNANNNKGFELCADYSNTDSCAATGSGSAARLQCVCSAGKFYNLGNGSCEDCSIGTFAGGRVFSVACSECSPGQFAARRSSVCLQCPHGWLQNAAKQAECQKCLAGQYNNDEGSGSCFKVRSILLVF